MFAVVAFVSGPALTWADTAPGPTGPAAPTARNVPASKDEAAGGIDSLIKHLHGQLKITSAQENLWRNVTNVMRENAATMSKLAKARSDSSKTMTAVDDLKSYAEISEAHAEGTKNMIAPFQALYDDMSAEQKKAADEEFREHYRGHHPHRH
ncbi:MAG: Spy/CpxP family protein refolding chaperone [Steroidobacteraceae bacterium]